MVALPIFVGFLLSGLPIFVVLGLSAFILFHLDGQSVIIVAQQTADVMNSEQLMSVPFFVMAANFMQRGGVATALVELSMAVVGQIRGSLGVVCVIACMLFASICGSSVACALAMSTLLYPEMVNRDYEKRFATGVLGASGTLGIMIPPSISLIVYGLITESSIPKLFLAGIGPALVQAFIFILWVLWYARRKQYPVERRTEPLTLKRLLKALPALAVPGVIGFGLYGGVVTVTETAAFSALVALFASLLFYRGFTWRQTLPIIGASVRTSAAITIIILTALVFSHWVVQTGVSDALINWIVGHHLQPWQFFLMVGGVMLVLGTMLEGAAMMLITVPVLAPLLKGIGIDPIHFGIFMVVNMEIALIHPPIGLNLYVLSANTGVSVGQIALGVIPFLLLLFLLLFLIAAIPPISLWLPNLVYP